MLVKNITVILLLGISSLSYADTDAERTALAKIIHELDALKPLIHEAQSQANLDKRPVTQYDWLLLDVHRVRSGVEELLLPPRTQPRSFPPLKGDYRH